MNPIKTGAIHVGKMVGKNNNIEILDLFNTGLCNDGLKSFANGLEEIGIQTNLRHLYLSINNIGIEACDDLNTIMKYTPNLESLYLGVNKWGDESLDKIATPHS